MSICPRFLSIIYEPKTPLHFQELLSNVMMLRVNELKFHSLKQGFETFLDLVSP